MGFNKCVISLDNINFLIEKYGEVYVMNLYKKCDCLIGDSDGIHLLNIIMMKYNPPADESHTRRGSDNHIPLQPSQD